MEYPIMTEEEYERRRSEAEERGDFPRRTGGVVYLYEEYAAYSGEPTGNQVELRWTEGKAPETWFADYGRSDLRLTGRKDRVS